MVIREIYVINNFMIWEFDKGELVIKLELFIGGIICCVILLC